MWILALKSFRNRKGTTLLTICSIALSMTLLLGVQHIRKEAKASFTQTISGTDLIVGARTGSVQLLLYSVFRMGNATNNISFKSYETIARSPKVKWTIPISLGDSHKGYRVMGTNTHYFTHFRFGNGRSLKMAKGDIFNDVFDAVLGSDVAAALKYDLNDEIILAHGAGEISFITHADKPFRVVGILKNTGTPIDRTIHIRLGGMEAIHMDWHDGAPPIPGESIPLKAVRSMDLTPHTITAFFVGLQSRMAAFDIQRYVNQYRKEALLAILPGVALGELWAIMGDVEKVLFFISALVLLVSLSGMLIALMTTLNERRREMAILRSLGARPIHIFSLIVGESILLTASGILFGILTLHTLLWAGHPLILAHYGIRIAIFGLSPEALGMIGMVLFSGTLIGFIPGYRIYRYALKDGMTIRL